MTEEDRLVVDRMRARAAQCRRLAKAIPDRDTAATLIKMAEEVEADIARLEAEGDDMPNDIPPPTSQT